MNEFKINENTIWKITPLIPFTMIYMGVGGRGSSNAKPTIRNNAPPLLIRYTKKQVKDKVFDPSKTNILKSKKM